MEGYLKMESNGHISLQTIRPRKELLSEQCYDSQMQNEWQLENEK